CRPRASGDPVLPGISCRTIGIILVGVYWSPLARGRRQQTLPRLALSLAHELGQQVGQGRRLTLRHALADGLADGPRIDRPHALPQVPARSRNDDFLAAEILLARLALDMALLLQAIDEP